MVNSKCDCHTHPYEKCHDRDGMRRFLEMAVEKGLESIYFTDHAPMNPELDAPHCLSEDDFKRYLEFAQTLRSEFKEVNIVIGAEIDYHPDNVEYAHRIINTYPLEWIIGSVHLHTNPWRDRITGIRFPGLCRMALQHTLDAVKTGLFDVIAHLDFFRWLTDPKRFGQWSGTYSPEEYLGEFDALFAEMSRRAMALEINTSGLRKVFDSVLPCREVLAIAKQHDLKLVAGSDAHDPEYVAYRFDCLDEFAG